VIGVSSCAGSSFGPNSWNDYPDLIAKMVEAHRVPPAHDYPLLSSSTPVASETPTLPLFPCTMDEAFAALVSSCGPAQLELHRAISHIEKLQRDQNLTTLRLKEVVKELEETDEHHNTLVDTVHELQVEVSEWATTTQQQGDIIVQ
jgi:hypothetical protein